MAKLPEISFDRTWKKSTVIRFWAKIKQGNITLFNNKPQFIVTYRKILKRLMILKLFQGKQRNFIRTRLLLESWVYLESWVWFLLSCPTMQLLCIAETCCFPVSISILFFTLVSDHSFHSILFCYRLIHVHPVIANISCFFIVVPILTLRVSSSAEFNLQICGCL